MLFLCTLRVSFECLPFLKKRKFLEEYDVHYRMDWNLWEYQLFEDGAGWTIHVFWFCIKCMIEKSTGWPGGVTT